MQGTCSLKITMTCKININNDDLLYIDLIFTSLCYRIMKYPVSPFQNGRQVN